MKRTFIMISAMLSATLLSIGCGNENNPVSANLLVGNWNLVTFSDKQDGFTLTAGQATDMGNGVTMTITGTLVFTETRYTATVTLTSVVQGGQPQAATEVTSGTYSISGNKLEVVDDGSSETEEVPFTLDGNRLTLDDFETTTVWERQ
ncbi:MAG: lipocalin family protein [bacterium]